MTPFVTREEAGLRPPKRVVRRVVPWITLHHGGDNMGWPWPHRKCVTIWRNWQATHMDKQNGLDIFYNSGVCPHGYRFEGRGPGVETGANGTRIGNQSSYAIVYIAGLGDPFTDEAKRALLDEQTRYGATFRYGHSDWKKTACPGPDRLAWVRAGCPPPEDDDMASPTHIGHDSYGQWYYITDRVCVRITPTAADRLRFLQVPELPSSFVDLALDATDGWMVVESR